MRSLSRLAIFGYAIAAYGAFGLSAVWAAGFLADRGAPTTVDGPATRPAGAALAIDAALLLAFAVQHTVMARAAFKRYIPQAIERSTFVLVASLLLIATFAWWQPVPFVVWNAGRPWSIAIWLLYAAGWALVVWSTFMVSHTDFLGLRQAWLHLRRTAYSPVGFSQRWLYQWVRHPMMLGLLVAFWATPRMTAGHLFFAAASSAYIAVGIRFEERDLRTSLGTQYEEYAARVPAVVPLSLRPHAADRDRVTSVG